MPEKTQNFHCQSLRTWNYYFQCHRTQNIIADASEHKIFIADVSEYKIMIISCALKWWIWCEKTPLGHPQASQELGGQPPTLPKEN